MAHPDGREHHTVTMPRRGINRERARETIMRLLARAEAQHHRVAFVITYRDGTQLTLGSKGGYDPARAQMQSRIEQDDPIAWIAGQLHDQRPDQRADAIMGIDIDAWPAPQ